ncbi:uncharacterized protein LOC132600257 [Lycium barbarum]|uniref:uncharacterized protein LOC132600257 n=1 Tax=Lycium barbarum TaxID=112863 RepID=UPI00293F3BBA|nr:uncharacterized protein LOC132600257 [Lycium barbarum]
MEAYKSSKTTPVKENLPTQRVEELIYPESMDTLSEIEISYHCSGYFMFSPSRKYVSGDLMKTNMDIDFISYFDLLDDLKKYYKFDIFEGDKFFYLGGDRVISDYDGLLECRDDLDVRKMLVSYKTHKEKSIQIYTPPKNCDIFMNTFLEENSYSENESEEVNEEVMEEHESANSTGIFLFFIDLF